MEILKIFTFLFILFISGCKSIIEDNEKYQKQRNNVFNVQDKITDIKTNFPLGYSELYIIENFLIVSEIFPAGDKGIHLFDKNTFKYITSTGLLGRGPGEITRKGSITIDFNNRDFWVNDHGKKIMWHFLLDSILNDESYIPAKHLEMYPDIFAKELKFINDSIALGKAVRPLSTNSFETVTAKLNLNTNTINEHGYAHPDAKGMRVSNSWFTLTVDNALYVTCYLNLDLMTICNLDGNLKYNVFGPDWSKNTDLKKGYFHGVDIINNKIIAAYLGEENTVSDNNRPRSNLPSKFLVFDLDGNYKHTINAGNKFALFCIDEENERIICYFDGRDNPLGYFNLNFD